VARIGVGELFADPHAKNIPVVYKAAAAAAVGFACLQKRPFSQWEVKAILEN